MELSKKAQNTVDWVKIIGFVLLGCAAAMLCFLHSLPLLAMACLLGGSYGALQSDEFYKAAKERRGQGSV